MESVKRGHYFQMLTLVYFVAASLVLGIVVNLTDLELGIVPALLISQFLMIGLVIIVYMLMTKSSPSITFMIKKISFVDGLICVGIAFTIGPLLNLVNVISQFFVTNQVTESLAQTLSLPYLVTIAMAALTPAVMEELLTRSIIIRNYRQQPVWIVCIMSGLFFGFIHMNMNQFAYAFVMGAIMCYIVMATGSVITSMIIHFVINASSITLLYLVQTALSFLDESGDLMTEMTEMSSDAPIEQLIISLIVVLIMAAIFTPVAVLLINTLIERHGKKWRGSIHQSATAFMDGTDTSAPIKEKIITPIYITTVIIFLVFAIMTEVTP